jgi:hypothetical protein
LEGRRSREGLRAHHGLVGEATELEVVWNAEEEGENSLVAVGARRRRGRIHVTSRKRMKWRSFCAIQVASRWSMAMTKKRAPAVSFFSGEEERRRKGVAACEVEKEKG